MLLCLTDTSLYIYIVLNTSGWQTLNKYTFNYPIIASCIHLESRSTSVLERNYNSP